MQVRTLHVASVPPIRVAMLHREKGVHTMMTVLVVECGWPHPVQCPLQVLQEDCVSAQESCEFLVVQPPFDGSGGLCAIVTIGY